MTFQTIGVSRLFPIWSLLNLLLASNLILSNARADDPAFRPPAVPLVTCDPYFSVWSQADRLWETDTTHWTGKPHRLGAFVRIDGTTYRLMGSSPQTLAALNQVALTILPTRTVYQFEGHDLSVTLTFTTPALPEDISILSRPTTYINCQAVSKDGKSHDVEFYVDAAGELATNGHGQQVSGESMTFKNATALKLGATSQNILGRSGDDLRIDWGYLYIAAPISVQASMGFGDADTLRQSFDSKGPSGLTSQSVSFPTPAASVVAAISVSLGEITSTPVSRYIVLAYDDLYSIEFMNSRLRPYWRKDGWEAEDLINAAITEHDDLQQRCETFDARLMQDLTKAGGEQYANIGALAFRQCFAAGKFVADANGQPLQFSKENHSNGCIATSDVFYPMAPQFLLFGPTLTKSFLVPFMEYAASDRWRFPFAPHDLGTYPKANGQVYGGGERTEEDQMPIEESGNLLLLFGALAQMEGNADFAAIYWKQLSQWALYLKTNGFDPANQLCTDDFAGHLAHNVNLSAKAICALAAYGKLCEMRGLSNEAAEYQAAAKSFAAQWMISGRDGDHFKLAFDRNETWSQKYNLVWDHILNLNLFPKELYQSEMAFYRKTQNAFGLPLDNRSDYTKLDWILWTATLTQNRDDFDALVTPVYRFLNQTPDRSPMTDWYFSSTAKKRAFTARPVVGGVFLKLLYDADLWKDYASRDITKSSNWAKLPVPPKTSVLIPTAASSEETYRYTTIAPPADWSSPDFNDTSWNLANGALGNNHTPKAPAKTQWNTSDVWLRRKVTIRNQDRKDLILRIWHDEDADVYVNGRLIVSLEGYSTDYEPVSIETDIFNAGENIIAIHCRQSVGGQFIDFGIDAIEPQSAAK